jgi:hypothetical protein
MNYLAPSDSQAGEIERGFVKGVISSAGGGGGYSVGFILNCRLNVLGMEAAHCGPPVCNFADALLLWSRLANLSTSSRAATPTGLNSFCLSGDTGRSSGVRDLANIGFFIGT